MDTHDTFHTLLDELDAALADDTPTSAAATASLASAAPMPSVSIGHRSPWRDELDVYRVRHEAFREKNREQRYELNRRIWNKKARDEYAERKKALGLTVRKYRRRPDAHPESNECPHQHRRRYDAARKREAYAANASAAGRAVRAYHDLSEMTDEERAAYKREQNRLRKQARRARLKEDDGIVCSVNLPRKEPHTFRV